MSQANDPVEVIRALSPGLGNMAAAIEGEKRGARGRTMTEYESLQARAIKAMGFRSTEEAISDDIRRIQGDLKKARSAKETEAIDNYIDNPSDKNMERLSELGIKASRIREEMKQKERTALERTEASTSRKNLGDLWKLEKFKN